MDDATLELSREWLLKAHDDLRSARKLSTGDDPIFTTAVYHCQQAAEKALKGFLVYHETPFEKTHNLIAIIELILPIDREFSELSEAAAVVSPYATFHRYPDASRQLSRADMDRALAAAERVYRFVLAKHPELDPEKKQP